MPITKSAKKKLRQDYKREKYNFLVKKDIRDGIKKFKESPSPTNLSKVFSLLDSGAKKKILHPNKAARLKSGLIKLIEKKTPSQKAKPASTRKKPIKKAGVENQLQK